MIETRSQYVTTIRGLLRARGQRLAGCDADVFLTRLREATFDEESKALCGSLLALLSALEPELAKTESAIQELAEREPMTLFFDDRTWRGPHRCVDVRVGRGRRQAIQNRPTSSSPISSRMQERRSSCRLACLRPPKIDAMAEE